MLFCLGDVRNPNQGIGYQQNNMVFNVKVSAQLFDSILSFLPTINLPVTYWINSTEMTDKEKKGVNGWSEMGGYLKVLDYKESWAKWWKDNNWTIKNKILDIPYFNKNIFTEITGLKDWLKN